MTGPSNAELLLDEPVFLLASERSGTNMTRAIIGAHPRFAAPTSPHLLMNFRSRMPCYGDLDRDDNFRRLSEDICKVLEHQLGEWVADIEPAEIVADAPTRSFIGVVDYVYHRELEACDADRMFFKENEAFFHFEYLLRHYPEAKFIYLVRDGRDMVLSYRRSLSHFGTIEDGAEIWRDEQRTCLSLLADPDLRERILPVHYEDILAFPEETVRQMCEFIGESFHPDMLEFHRERSNVKAAESVHSWDNISSPIMRSNYGKYRRGFNEREIEKIESIMYRELRLAGYPLEHTVEKYSNAGGLKETILKGWQFTSQVLKLRKMMDIDEFLMRRERVGVLGETWNSLQTDHMEPMLTCRALSAPN